MEQQEEAALILQCCWRRGLAYRQLGQLKQERLIRLQHIDKTVRFIQRCYRGFRGRQWFKGIKRDKAHWLAMKADMQKWAATQIQVNLLLGWGVGILLAAMC